MLYIANTHQISTKLSRSKASDGRFDSSSCGSLKDDQFLLEGTESSIHLDLHVLSCCGDVNDLGIGGLRMSEMITVLFFRQFGPVIRLANWLIYWCVWIG